MIGDSPSAIGLLATILTFSRIDLERRMRDKDKERIGEMIMAKQRPLSPHLMIYKPQLTTIMSIMHRMTGGALAMGSLLVVWWMVALASGAEYYAFVQTIIGHWMGQLVIFGFSVAVFYHLSNGIRHLLWDFGYNLSIEGVHRSGYIVLVMTLVLTALTWVSVWASVWTN